ncbi:MAG TPA: HDOD domain-containing protein [Burkholderiaceae bacterium]|nr:HDOD domain-containing protein [Burkholderiaceae bacterium]
MFEFADRNPTRDRAPDPAALSAIGPGWRMLVGRDRRPMGVRLTLNGTRAQAEAPPLSALLDGVLAGLTSESDGRPVFPHGLIVLSPRGVDIDQAMSGWRAPRNVLLEFGQGDLDDERWLRRLFEIQKQGVRIALRLDQPIAPPPERLSYFQYVVAPSRQVLPPAIDSSNVSILTLDDSTHEDIDAGFAAGVHATAGWPLAPVRRAEPSGLTPAQTAVFELIRLVQADAEVRVLERVFRAEPLLAYLLLTLANSAAFRRSTPVSSLSHAISLLGYQRLIKWLVLLLAIAGKEPGAAPLVYVAVVRGHLLENLCAAGRRSRGERDDAFIVGTFSLLDAITGQPLRDLLQDVHLSDPIVDALLAGTGPYAPLLEIARGFEAADPLALVRTRAGLNVDAADANWALLQALATADCLQSLIR